MSTYAKSEKTRQLIIERSAELFNKKGYAGTSLSDITEAAQLTKGALYGHFTDKEQLALEVFNYNTDRILSGFNRYLESVSTVSNKFKVMLQFYAENHLELTRMGGCPFLSAAVEFDDQPGPLKERVRERFKLWENTLVNIIIDGQTTGEIKNDISPAKYANLFIAMMEGALLLTQLNNDPQVLMTSFEQIEKIIQAELVSGE